MTQFKIAVCVFLQNEANFSSSLQRALLFGREVGAPNGLSPERSQYACYFAWQLRAQVWVGLSQALRQEVLNVAGQLFAARGMDQNNSTRRLGGALGQSPSALDSLSEKW
jgi:hypothetical protein